MANISDAFGKVTIYGESKELLQEFLKLQEKANNNVYYNTDLLCGEILDNNHDIYKAVVTCDVNGSGRWTFTSNINWFFSTTFNNVDSDIINHKFLAKFEIVDTEFGFDFIEDLYIDVEWNPNTKTQITVNEDVVSYKITADLLVSKCLYDKWSYFDADFILKNWDEFINIITDDITNENGNDNDIKLYNYILSNQNETKQYLESIRNLDYVQQDEIYEVFNNEYNNIKPFIKQIAE